MDIPPVYNLAYLSNEFRHERTLPEAEVLALLQRVSSVFRSEPNVVRVSSPVTIVGDIHGQYYDLLKLFELHPVVDGKGAAPPSFLFLGDYMDRGYFGCEVVLHLFALKLHYPTSVYLLRGNHECRRLTGYFNSKKEVVRKYSLRVYHWLMEVFDTLPLAAVVDGKYFCVHGGISPFVRYVHEIEWIHRFREPPPHGPMCDLLWADPMEDSEEKQPPSATSPSKHATTASHHASTDGEERRLLFAPNELRGCSYVYSSAAVACFLAENQLLCIVRAHEAQDEGYRLYLPTPAAHGDTSTPQAGSAFPQLICIFSAPNYCDMYDNKAATLTLSGERLQLRQFVSSPHPYHLPNFMHAFEWSLPFLVEHTLSLVQRLVLTEEDGLVTDEETDAVSFDAYMASSVASLHKDLTSKS